jgi:hypothetical protein
LHHELPGGGRLFKLASCGFDSRVVHRYDFARSVASTRNGAVVAPSTGSSSSESARLKPERAWCDSTTVHQCEVFLVAHSVRGGEVWVQLPSH